jgi:hypothetical protein
MREPFLPILGLGMKGNPQHAKFRMQQRRALRSVVIYRNGTDFGGSLERTVLRSSDQFDRAVFEAVNAANDHQALVVHGGA